MLFGGTIDYPVDHSSIFSWNVGIDYNLSDYLRLGFALSKIPQQEVHGRDCEYEYAHGTSYSLLVEYVPAPASPLFTSRSEFAIAVGLSYNLLSVNGTLSALFGSAIIERPVSFAVKENIFGLHLRISYDYYLLRYLSLQLKGEGMLVPSIDVPTVSHTNPYNNEVKILRQHSVNFSNIDFSIGLRFHL